MNDRSFHCADTRLAATSRLGCGTPWQPENACPRSPASTARLGGAPFRLTLACLAVFHAFILLSAEAGAEPGTCNLQTASSVICSGDQSAGIATGRTGLASGGQLLTPPITTISVDGLSTPIAPASGSSGIYFHNEAGSALTLNAGTLAAPIGIASTDDSTAGVMVNAFGTQTATVQLFSLTIPVGGGGNGGAITVNTNATISTDGDASPGISARSRAGGYPPAVVDAFTALRDTNQGQTFTLSKVEGDSANINKAVTGSKGGSFTLSNGTSGMLPTFTYNLTGMALADLKAGEHIDTAVLYSVVSWVGQPPSDAQLTLRVTRLADGSLSVLPSTYFVQYGKAYEAAAPITYVAGSTVTGQISLQPDFDAYMTRLLADSAVGGAGGNVIVNARGSITTNNNLSLGQGSYGILAQSKGGSGLSGGGGVFSADAGNPGAAGGSVTVNNWAEIHTHGEGAHGIVASSSGGDGGQGGSTSFAGNGAAGGTGAKGGAVTVNNNGKITTELAGAFGILAQSVGGRGGVGGDGGWLGGGGGSGGTTTVNDAVNVHNAGEITTHGAGSHGIMAQNIGGFGGTGGGASGIVALGSTGGNAGSGGLAHVDNSAKITTTGTYANAIIVQSIGGGGGSAGGTGGLVALGGDGSAGGNGGLATITNSGELSATGLGSVGILAQSIGGGGGNGGDSIGLVPIGGAGATTSDGGVVTVGNAGKITSSANAIFAESVGGGGGTGGSSIGWFAIGGTGGGGGKGGSVNVTNSGDLTTTGRNASALFAQSVGGGGGHGGNVVAVGAFVSMAIGGAGGIGGDADEVVVNSTGGKIETMEEQSHGIFAQSLGGKGGSGGFAVSVAAGKGLSMALSIGGAGGGGGDGKHVQVDSQSEIVTHKEDSHGIYAQSVGGGGGSGGFAASAAGTVDGIAASFAIGGSGAQGGDGGLVEVGKTAAIGGTITTSGKRSDGIFAQSVGGGGGNGGLSVAGDISGGGSGGGFALSLGGSGGDGGNGSAVKVNSQAIIKTSGEKAYGIRAQSLGGGGGEGGLAVAGSIGGGGGGGGTPGSVSLKFDFAIGGSGGKGGSGSTVDIDLSGGRIETTGYAAHGLFAQSVGGGGGVGGMAITGSLGLGANNVNLSFAVGGKGGVGGDGDKVSVRNDGSIKTSGEAAFGIFAQSIGGGGGIGGASYSGEAVANLGKLGPNFNIGFAFGGAGGAGGNGGVVEVSNSGSIETSGIAAHGIFAESVGGGGGQGGSARTMALNYSSGLNRLSSQLQVAFNLNLGGSGGAAGDGKQVTVNNSGSIVTNGTDSHGIYAQSVGGGGGTGGEGAHGFFGVPTILFDKTPFMKDVSISMGGSAGAAGDGGAVTVNQCVGVTPGSGENCGSITTKQDSSHAIFAQSVGGGGGTGGVGLIGFTGKLGIGGSGGASGDAGKVDVVANGSIDTYGIASYGVFAQSVGGGGGIAGNVDRGISRWVKGGIGRGFGIVASSENGGNGGEVMVMGNGSIHTRGLGATAIFAQSVGGGGGAAGSQTFFGITGSAGGNGSGDKVTVDWTGSIVTEGSNAHGIYAQSAGGISTETHYTYDKDGTPVAITLTPRQNLGKDVLVDVKGSVITLGDESAAIYAQSTGDQGNGNVTVKLATGGRVVGGKGTGVGIEIVGGASNLIENRGNISAFSGQAILGDSASERVDNYGTITGSVDLGSGNNPFNNLAGSTFNPLATIALGSGQLLTNDGTLSPGGRGNVQTSTLSGNLLQSGSGVLGMDYSLAGRSSDRLNIVGSAQLGGSIVLNPIDTGRARTGAQQIVVVSASGGATPNNLTLTAPRSRVVSYALDYPSANEVAVSSQVDFKPRGLSGNAARLGDYLNAAQMAGGSDSLAPYIAALLGISDESALKTAYEKLAPGALGTLTKASTSASLEFNDAMHSCRQRDGDYRFIREGECSWVRFGGSIRDQERDDQNPGYRQDMVTMAGGFQKAVRENLHLGLGVSYQQSALNSVFSDVNGERFEGGMILKQRYDATRLSLSFSAGYGHYNTRRLVDIAAPGTYAQARPTLWSSSLHGRISHDIMASENAYIRPMLGLGVSYVSRDAYDETGAGGANLRVEKASDTFVSLHPAIEFGGENSVGGEGNLLRHFVRVGMTQFLGSNEHHVTASLEGAPSGIQPFTVTTRSDKTYADLVIGIDILRKSGTTVRLEYSGQFSNNSSTNAIGVKLAMPF